MFGRKGLSYRNISFFRGWQEGIGIVSKEGVTCPSPLFEVGTETLEEEYLSN